MTRNEESGDWVCPPRARKQKGVSAIDCTLLGERHRGPDFSSTYREHSSIWRFPPAWEMRVPEAQALSTALDLLANRREQHVKTLEESGWLPSSVTLGKHVLVAQRQPLSPEK